MASLIGPDFIGVQTYDLDSARAFYEGVVGLKFAAHSPSGTVVFDTEPVAFAVRTPPTELTGNTLGESITLWFRCDDADALHDQLVEQGATIVLPSKDGQFDRYFAFRDPFGYAITPHTAG